MGLTKVTPDEIDKVFWEEIGRVSASGTQTSISVTIPQRKFLKILVNGYNQSTSSNNFMVQFNGDTGANYGRQQMSVANGGTAPVVNTNDVTGFFCATMGSQFAHSFADLEMSMFNAANWKHGYLVSGSATENRNSSIYWKNAVNAITSVTLASNQASGMGNNTTLIVLGHD